MITYGSITLTSYNSIVTTIIYYYQSISPTDLIGGTWSTTKPEWEEGTYVWQKLRTIYEDGTFSESDAVNITGQQGKSGEAASSYKLTSSESAIALLKTGEYSTNQITFSATYKQGNNPIAPYNGGFIIQYSINGAEWVTDYTSLSNESSKTYTVPENILIIKCLLYQTKDCDELLDIVTIPIIKDGIDGTGVTNSFPIYLVSDKDKGITLDDHGWTRFKPSLDAERKYLWIDYISRYAEGNIKPQLIEKTGNKITFEYHGERSPFESVIIDITPVQSGSGTPSSGNKRHISGWTSIDIGQADINLMPYEEGKYMLDLPEDIGTLDNQTLNLKNTMFTIQGDTLIITKGDLGTHIAFPKEVGTVYGGKYNVTTGVLMVTHGYINKYNNEPLPSTWISDRNVYVKGTKPSVGAQVVFKLNEPLIYELTPQEIMIFKHSNSIYASTGDISISYYDYQTTTSPYIDYALVSAFDASTAALEEATQLKQDFQELQENIQTQLDQKVETWCQINDPALSWTTADLKQQHNGDLWYYIGESNMSYKNNTTYKYVASTGKWMPYAISADLFDKIDTKTTIYYGQTTDTFSNVEAGDYLVDSTDGSTYRYENDQWVKVTDYASAISELEQEINNMQEDLQSQIDGKVQTWYQPTDPALNWPTEEKQNHTGDLWFNSSATVMKTYRYNGNTWNEQTVSKAVFDQIDGKAQVFINTPTPPYQTGDLWFNSNTSEIMTCIADRASGSYTASDWAKRNKYTDDTKATEANNKVTSVYGTCNTTAGTTAKVVVCPNFVLFEGARIQVTFEKASTVSNPALNVNGTGAKTIYIGTTPASITNYILWGAGAKIEFVYDGTGWVLQNAPYALYGTCESLATSATKVVVCPGAVICKGTSIAVEMTNTNSVATPKLNVDKTLARNIYANNDTLAANSRFNWRANTTPTFVFDGEVWRIPDDTTREIATAYITEIDNNGIMVHPEDDYDNGWKISDAIELFKDGWSYIKLWIEDTIAKIRIGNEDEGHIILDNDSVDIKDNEDVLASFGETTTIGRADEGNVTIGNNSVDIQEGEDTVASFGTTTVIGKSTEGNILIDNTGMDIRKGDDSVANFGETARIGKEDGGNVYADSRNIYIKDRNTILSTFSASLTQIGNVLTRHLDITNVGVFLYSAANTLLSSFTPNAVSLYIDNKLRTVLRNTGLVIYDTDGSTELANFGTTVNIGKKDHAYLEQTASRTNIYGYNNGEKVISYGVLNNNTTGLAIIQERKPIQGMQIGSKYYYGINAACPVVSLISCSINGTSIDISTLRFQSGENPFVYQTTNSITSGKMTIRYRTNANAPYFSMGSSTIIGIDCVSSGDYNNISGKNCTAFGNGITINGENVFAIGNGTTATGENSFAGGLNSIASGDDSFAVGVQTYATQEGQFVCGWNNSHKNNALFIVGNGGFSGSNNDTANAFEVLQNGDAHCYGSMVLDKSNYTDASTATLKLTAGTGNHKKGNSVGLMATYNGEVGVYDYQKSNWMVYQSTATNKTHIPNLGLSGSATGTINSTFNDADQQYCYLKQIGKTVFMSMALTYNNASKTINTETTLFTIPDSCRPSTDIYLPAQFVRISTTSTLNTASAAVIKINTAGAITQSHSSNAYSIYCFGMWETD